MSSMKYLYHCYWILASAKENVHQHKDSYITILNAVMGGYKEKKMAAELIPRFFQHFPDLGIQALHAHIRLCKDEDILIRHRATKNLIHFATKKYLKVVANLLTQLLQSDDMPVFDYTNKALLHVFCMDAKVTVDAIFAHIGNGEDIVRDRAIRFLQTNLQMLPNDVLTEDIEKIIFAETKKVLHMVTREQFIVLVTLVSTLKINQDVKGWKKLLDMANEQGSTC